MSSTSKSRGHSPSNASDLGPWEGSTRDTNFGTWHLPSLPCPRSQQPLTSPDRRDTGKALGPRQNDALVAGIPTIMIMKGYTPTTTCNIADWTVLGTDEERGNRSRSLKFSCFIYLLTRT